MSVDANYLRGYAKILRLMEKMAYVDPRSDDEIRASIARGNKWKGTAQGYIDNVFNSKYNFREPDLTRQYHIVDPSLTSAETKNKDLRFQEQIRHRQHKLRNLEADAHWWNALWNKPQQWAAQYKLDRKRGQYANWQRNMADRAAKRSAGTSGMTFEEFLREREKNPGAIAVQMPVGGDWNTQAEQYRAVYSGVQDELSKKTQKKPKGTIWDPSFSVQDRAQMRQDTDRSLAQNWGMHSPWTGWTNPRNWQLAYGR